MAQKPIVAPVVKWKLGSKCDLFDREQYKWIEAEVIGVFEDEGREWVKVRCGQTVRDVRSVDPDLRQRTLLQSGEMKKLQHAAVQQPDIAPILQRVLPTSSGEGLYSHSESSVDVHMPPII